MREASIALPAILDVDHGALERIGGALGKDGFRRVVLIFGSGIETLVAQPIQDSLRKHGIEVVECRVLEDTAIESIVDFAFALPSGVDALVGAGGGRALDYAKYVSFLRKFPFISVPTSPSNDGFASPMSSLTVRGRRTTVPARIPYGIVADLGVIKGAPEKFLFSGIGDLVSNITALYDWRFEEANGRGEVNHFAEMISKKAVNSFVRTPFSSLKEDFFLKELVDSLTLNGIAMEIAGNSAPASGSEHLISHALDQLLEQSQMHGIQVGLATYLMSRVQEHRFQRISTILNRTGFFDFARTLHFHASDWERAIDLAPTIKPDRYTFLHLPENRARAKEILRTDGWLRDVIEQD